MLGDIEAAGSVSGVGGTRGVVTGSPTDARLPATDGYLPPIQYSRVPSAVQPVPA
jgi:hypothetical protein